MNSFKNINLLREAKKKNIIMRMLMNGPRAAASCRKIPFLAEFLVRGRIKREMKKKGIDVHLVRMSLYQFNVKSKTLPMPGVTRRSSYAE